MNSRQAVLSLFHPLVAQWFKEKVGSPTDVQQQAWPKIAGGKHLLITAPTGSGKTLAAFLWAINQLIEGKWATGQTSVIYISPLRALNYDIQRNLLGPLRDLKEIFVEAGEAFPAIQVLTRSGDTPQPDRRRMLRHPPEILITTPESLNLLLSSPVARSILKTAATVILDEIHAVVGNKRGVYLMAAVERLVRLAGEFQRIGLSATIRPLETVAEFVGGFRIEKQSGEAQYLPRPVAVVRSDAKKQYLLGVKIPPERVTPADPTSPWSPYAVELKEIVKRNRSTLVFVNSRRLCETLTAKMNEEEEEPLAYAHHGSLSLEIRSEVERKLKAGELRAIVATNSLELGIDIGALDEVVMVQSPFTISSAIQRVGRAGHQVGEISRGTLLPTHSKDIVEAAVLASAILDQDIEATQPVLCPLDVLAQVIVSMTGVEVWDIDDLHRNLRANYAYRTLSREQFELVLNMLAGRYAQTRLRELKPYISIDRLDNTVTARKGALQSLYLSGGVIPDRGYFHLRHQETLARIGELDEEFVWEASVGQSFTLGTQNWQVQRITQNDVFVLPTRPKATAAPFWKGEESNRDFHFSEKIARFLEEADGRLDDPEFSSFLQQRHFLDETAASQLIDFLKRQKEATGCHLPHRHHLVVEGIDTGPGGSPGNQVVIHNFWGGRVNRPFAMALDAAWEARFGYRLEFYVGNDGVVLLVPHDIGGEELLSLVGSAGVETLLRNRLEGSGFFGARFRECAGRALLLARAKFNERLPLWLSRLRSQKLLEAVRKFEDFPILLEAWRTCLQDEFDFTSLKQLLRELETGTVAWTEVHTSHPSPFVQSDWWRQVNSLVYMDDSPRSDQPSKLRGSLLREVVFSPGLRPLVSRELVRRFELKRQRLTPGYSPSSSRELLDWVKERLLIPRGEWESLLQAIRRDQESDAGELLRDLEDKLVNFRPPLAAEPLVASRETWPRLQKTFFGREEDVSAQLDPVALVVRSEPSAADGGGGEDMATLLGEWLRFYGPMTADFILRTLGIERERLSLALEDLVDDQKIIQGPLVIDGPGDEICDAENFEILLRLTRSESQPVFETLGVDWLPLLLAKYQGVTDPPGKIERLKDRLEQLLGYPAEAEAWETEIFPARLHPYDPSWLDTLMQEGDLQWVGGEGRKIAFCYREDLDLLQEDFPGEKEVSSASPEPTVSGEAEDREEGAAGLFSDPAGGYDFSSLLKVSKGNSVDLANRLWAAVWQGRVTNDTFITLRRAILNHFKIPEGGTKEAKMLRRRMRSRVGSAKSREARLFAGNWHLLPRATAEDDLLEIEERRKDRARLALNRYGILFREILHKELPPMRWAGIFRSLRLMELSGEVMAGYFFKGIPGPQFISPQAFRYLQGKLPEETVYWLNATDPASLCGVPLEALKGGLPPRVAGTHLVYRGTQVVMVSKRNGQELTFRVPPEDPHLSEYFGVFHHLLNRQFQPVRRIAIETINGEKAPQSPYLPALRNSFDVLVDYKYVNLQRKL